MQRDFLKQLKEIDNFTFTENGAVALKSTGNYCLDAFGSLGSAKSSSVEYIIDTFAKAFAENKNLAMRMLFYIRDIRGGQGMRRVFRLILRYLAFNYPDLVVKNLDNILFFGRGDDYLALIDTPVEKEMMEYCFSTLTEDLNSVKAGGMCSLLAKWMPSENTSSKLTKYAAKRFIKGFGISAKEYRKLLSILRKEANVVEVLMSNNEWDKIDFEKLPSKASMIYSDAFFKHAEQNYRDYIKKLASGEAKINAGALFPVDIIHKISNFGYRAMTLKDRLLFDAMWKALPNYFEEAGIDETGICVVDTSGSMYGTPLEVAISLGIYCADKCRGPFKDHFFTFSVHPDLQEIIGNDIVEKYCNLSNANWDGNTNIEAVFDLILKTVIANKVAQEDLPSKLYIISDMQWDNCVVSNTEVSQRNTWGYSHVTHYIKPETFIETMAKKYAAAGYKLPAIVYWNVSDYETGIFQQKFNEGQCCMVSGYSPSLFKSIIQGTEYVEEKNENGETVIKQKIDPMTIMLNTLNNERYDRVVTE